MEWEEVRTYFIACPRLCNVWVHVSVKFCLFGAEAQQNRERVIQTVDSAAQGGDGRIVAPGLHQLPVRPIAQNGRHASAAVATENSLASGKNTGIIFFIVSVFISSNDVFSPSRPGLNSPLQILAAQASSSPPVLVSRQPSVETPAEHSAEPQAKRPKMEDDGGSESAQHQVTSAQQPVIVSMSSQARDLRK